MPAVDLVRARIKRILQQFDSDELKQFVSGVNDNRAGDVDDGDYGAPERSTKPDFVQKELDGWTSDDS